MNIHSLPVACAIFHRLHGKHGKKVLNMAVSAISDSDEPADLHEYIHANLSKKSTEIPVNNLGKDTMHDILEQNDSL